MTKELEINILSIIEGMTRTEAYKWWGKFRKEITPREFRKFVQEHIPLSKRYYECKALELPRVVKPTKHVGKKKLQFLAGLRKSRSRKNNYKKLGISAPLYLGKLKKSKRIAINKIKQR